jgi:hypothetical protein
MGKMEMKRSRGIGFVRQHQHDFSRCNRSDRRAWRWSFNAREYQAGIVCQQVLLRT